MAPPRGTQTCCGGIWQVWRSRMFRYSDSNCFCTSTALFAQSARFGSS
ncbi:unnamed protein product [Chondrus crispus]|uniref:Uncharacterized protein n=1 Tax=Chondrus crispus TaxID=2769 RepID=R7Q872_CHOCR|nr:unnamed protein product [Chondrus crispus]CDF33685.1 unnamed protein product [Chondrus crispus]|eukprot:XP_005713504.1 unnamed protein product [Chondrus crispus]